MVLFIFERAGRRGGKDLYFGGTRIESRLGYTGCPALRI